MLVAIDYSVILLFFVFVFILFLYSKVSFCVLNTKKSNQSKECTKQCIHTTKNKKKMREKKIRSKWSWKENCKFKRWMK